MSSRARILLVEDDPLSLANTRLLLEVNGFAVTAVPTCEQALEILERQPPDLVVCDVMMSGMNGLDLLARVRSRPAIARTPMIMLTALVGTENRVRGMNGGADDYLEKPFKPADLLGAIDARLRRFSALTENSEGGVADRASGLGRADVERSLTNRERAVFELVGQALSTSEIAERLAISPRTVETHRANIIGKLRLRSAFELVRVAAVLSGKSVR